MQALPKKHLHASTCSLTNSAEGETEDSNIDSRAERMVNVFWTQPVLGFVSHMGDCLGRGPEWHQQEEQVWCHCPNARLTQKIERWHRTNVVLLFASPCYEKHSNETASALSRASRFESLILKDAEYLLCLHLALIVVSKEKHSSSRKSERC